MLPSYEECRKRIQIFHSKYPDSSFNEFWRYKREVESSAGHILDDSHLDETVTRLVKNLLLRDDWDLWWTGVASVQKIKEILKNISGHYKFIKDIELGDGQVANERVRNELSHVYTKFNLPPKNWGITHNCGRGHDSPDHQSRYYILGRSKVLMFIWGQTPGFDTRVRRSLAEAGLRSHYPWIEEKRWKSSEFCDILTELDRQVRAWEEAEGKKFQESLSPNRPVGRIIDIIYWTECEGSC